MRLNIDPTNGQPTWRMLVMVSLLALASPSLVGCSFDGGGDDDEEEIEQVDDDQDDDDDDDRPLDTAPHPELPADTEATLSPTHKPTLVGVVIDSPVANLRFSGTDRSGATDGSGNFSFTLGETLFFSVGDTVFPPLTATQIITAFDLAATPDPDNLALINTARFLQSLDVDGDVSNGITISEQAHDAATGISLDFNDPEFDAAANPIVAASGSTNTSLVDGTTAVSNLQAAVAALPPSIPVAGNWSRGTGNSLEVLFLLENGQWFHIMANCSLTSQASYEHGTFQYLEGTNTLVFTATSDPDTCGFNSSAQSVASFTHPITTLTIDGQDWNPVNQQLGTAQGAYFLQFDPESVDGYAVWAFLASNEFVSYGFRGENCLQTGTYSVNSSEEAILVLNEDSCGAGISGLYFSFEGGINYGHLPRELYAYSSLDDDEDYTYVSLVPSTTGGSLTGYWSAGYARYEEDAGVSFTPDGRIIVIGGGETTVDPDAIGIEKGVYSWNSQTGEVVIDITRDDDQGKNLGLAYLSDGENSKVNRLVVTGNLLRVEFSDREPEIWNRYFKPEPAVSIEGLWSRETAGGGPKTLAISGFGQDYSVVFLDDDCPNTVGKIEWGEIVNYDGTKANFTLFDDNAGCGAFSLGDGAEITLSSTGDRLDTQLGTFYRVK